MSERSSISLSEVLGDNYYIDKLTSSDYSPSVGDTVTITLLVKDVFGDPVTGQTRTVTCTGGQFVSVNGTSITASSSVDVTTSSSGTVTLGLSVSVADNIIVSDGRAECVVSSLSDSIANLIQVQSINTSYASCNSLYSVERTATVTACPSGYSYLFIPQNGYRSVTRFSGLSGTTASFQVTNISSSTQNVNATGWLVYYPSTWR
jgi:hypothetical protein